MVIDCSQEHGKRVAHEPSVSVRYRFKECSSMNTVSHTRYRHKQPASESDLIGSALQTEGKQ